MRFEELPPSKEGKFFDNKADEKAYKASREDHLEMKKMSLEDIFNCCEEADYSKSLRGYIERNKDLRWGLLTKNNTDTD